MALSLCAQRLRNAPERSLTVELSYHQRLGGAARQKNPSALAGQRWTVMILTLRGIHHYDFHQHETHSNTASTANAQHIQMPPQPQSHVPPTYPAYHSRRSHTTHNACTVHLVHREAACISVQMLPGSLHLGVQCIKVHSHHPSSGAQCMEVLADVYASTRRCTVHEGAVGGKRLLWRGKQSPWWPMTLRAFTHL